MSELNRFLSIFPVKVMGVNREDFEPLVLEIIQKHASLATDKVISKRLSRNGRFLSVTVYINAESQAQLDAIYRELSTHKRVLMML